MAERTADLQAANNVITSYSIHYTKLYDHGCADRKRKAHTVAEAIGEEQLGRRQMDVVFAHADRLDAVALAGDDLV